MLLMVHWIIIIIMLMTATATRTRTCTAASATVVVARNSTRSTVHYKLMIHFVIMKYCRRIRKCLHLLLRVASSSSTSSSSEQQHDHSYSSFTRSSRLCLLRPLHSNSLPQQGAIPDSHSHWYFVEFRHRSVSVPWRMPSVTCIHY